MRIDDETLANIRSQSSSSPYARLRSRFSRPLQQGESVSMSEAVKYNMLPRAQDATAGRVEGATSAAPTLVGVNLHWRR
jgi:hypothetical protein